MITWRIIPFSKWVITMVTNHLLNGMILQVWGARLELNWIAQMFVQYTSALDLQSLFFIGWSLRVSTFFEGFWLDNHRFQEAYHLSIPIPSMYGIFTYIWLIFMGNVGKYTIHGWYGIFQLVVDFRGHLTKSQQPFPPWPDFFLAAKTGHLVRNIQIIKVCWLGRSFWGEGCVWGLPDFF